MTSEVYSVDQWKSDVEKCWAKNFSNVSISGL